MKKYLVEFIGTFFLVLAVCMAGSKAGDMAPLAIGGTLMVMIFAGGYISGAHYNPAVSLAVFIRGKLALTEMFVYWICQLLGGAAAAFIAVNVFGYMAVPGGIMVTQSLVAEFLGTFALAYVVLHVATSNKTTGNSYYGLAIGFTVVAMAYTLGPVSGGAFNPAVALGATVFGAFAWANLWIYLVGCLAGGLLAGIVYNITNTDNE